MLFSLIFSRLPRSRVFWYKYTCLCCIQWQLSFKRFGTKTASFLKRFKLQPYLDSVPIPGPFLPTPRVYMGWEPMGSREGLQSCATRFLKFLERSPPLLLPMLNFSSDFFRPWVSNESFGRSWRWSSRRPWFKTQGLGSFKTYRVARNFSGSFFLRIGDFLCFVRTNFCY